MPGLDEALLSPGHRHPIWKGLTELELRGMESMVLEWGLQSSRWGPAVANRANRGFGDAKGDVKQVVKDDATPSGRHASCTAQLWLFREHVPRLKA